MNIDISKKILKTWEGAGIDMGRISSDPFEVSMNGLASLDQELWMFKFKMSTIDLQPIKREEGIWSDIVKCSQRIDCLVGSMTFTAGLHKNRADGFGGISHADCYVEFRFEIDESKLTEEQWDKMTKPDFFKNGDCDKGGQIMKSKGKKSKKQKQEDPEIINDILIDEPIEPEIIKEV